MSKRERVVCSFCQTENPGGDRFCGGCGGSLTPWLCPGCRSDNPAGSRFCRTCGGQSGSTVTCPNCQEITPAARPACQRCGQLLSGRPAVPSERPASPTAPLPWAAPHPPSQPTTPLLRAAASSPTRPPMTPPEHPIHPPVSDPIEAPSPPRASRFLAFCKAFGATSALLTVILTVLLVTGSLVDRFSASGGSALTLGMSVVVFAFYVGISVWLGHQAGWPWAVLGVLFWPGAFATYVYRQNRGKVSATTGLPFPKFPTLASGGGLLAVSAALLVTALVVKDRGANAAVQADGARPTATAATVSSRLDVTATSEAAGTRSERPTVSNSGEDAPKDVPSTALGPEPTATAKTSLTSDPAETPKPTSTPRPRPTATATAEPTATERPRSTATSTPKPTATPKPTSTPVPTSTPRPTPTAAPPAARFDPDELVSVLLRAPFTGEEKPGSSAPEVSTANPGDPAALAEVRALGDHGMITFTVYASDADAMEGVSLDLGMAISSSTYPAYPMVVFPNDGDGASLASLVVGNVVVSGFTTEALIALSGFDNAESMAMVLAERGVAHLERVASRSPGRADGGQQPTTGSKATITEPDINLRAAAATNADVVAVLDQGEKLRITGTAVEGEGLVWWPVEVRATGQTGYVAEQFLAFEPGGR